MTLQTEERRKAAVRHAIKDGEIPTDEPIYAVYVDQHCPECGQKAKGISQVSAWSHIGSERARVQKMECWNCENINLQTHVWFSEWDAPLENLPPSAIPERYHD